MGIRDAPTPGGEAQKTWLQAKQVESAKTQHRKEHNVPYLIRAGASGWSSEGGIQGELAVSGARCGRELNMEVSSVAEGTARHEFREELHG